jgi:hypothetical protein
MMLELDLMQWKDKLSFSNTPDGRYIFCYIRRRFYVSTPEELVRQLTIQHLVNIGMYAKGLINLEKGISVNGLTRRFDLVVYNSDGSPLILVECKAPTVKLSQKTFEQISAYNLEVKAPYLVITNGIKTYAALIDFEQRNYTMLDHLPAKEQ